MILRRFRLPASDSVSSVDAVMIGLLMHFVLRRVRLAFVLGSAILHFCASQPPPSSPWQRGGAGRTLEASSKQHEWSIM